MIQISIRKERNKCQLSTKNKRIKRQPIKFTKKRKKTIHKVKSTLMKDHSLMKNLPIQSNQKIKK